MTSGARAIIAFAYLSAQGALAGSAGMPLHAQQPSTPLVDPASLSFEHDGKDVTGFAAYFTRQGGQPLRVDLGALRPDAVGKVVAPIPPLPAGTYTIEVVAYNTTGESARVAAEPSRFQVTSRRAVATESRQERAIDSAPSPVEPKATAQAAPKAETKAETKAKKGFFGKLYDVIVGSDDEGDPQGK